MDNLGSCPALLILANICWAVRSFRETMKPCQLQQCCSPALPDLWPPCTRGGEKKREERFFKGPMNYQKNHWSQRDIARFLFSARQDGNGWQGSWFMTRKWLQVTNVVIFLPYCPHDEIITKNVDDPISPSWIPAALGGIVVLPTCRGFKSQYLNLSNGIFINGFNHYCVSKQGDTFGKFCSHSPLFWYGLCYYYYYYYLMTPSLYLPH